MNRPRRYLAALVLGAALATSPLPAAAEGEALETAAAGFRGVVDVVVLRPVGVARLALGAAVLLPMKSFFDLVGLPFSRDTTVFAEDFDKFIVEPAEYTFKREIGQDLEGF